MNNIAVDNVTEQLKKLKVVPVVTLKNASHAKTLAHLLVEYQLPCVEVTYRTSNAAEMIAVMRESEPALLIGAGTILSEEQLDSAIEAGVDFAVSPGLNPAVTQAAQNKGLPFIPGINNPTAVEQAMALGVNIVKFFPAEISGGLDMLKALASVYPVTFMPTGGLTFEKVKQYLSHDSVLCCGGTWVASRADIEDENWDTIRENLQKISTEL